MSDYLTTIGLEIHAELKTKTKMFCNSRNNPDEEKPNANICPVCMGHPGTLPVINKEAVKHVIKVGLALGGTIADFTEFDRKNYFYPDIPKGYQLSQYEFPLVSGGTLHNVAITRVHLEEDTATSLHDRGDYSLVDFNRAGVPLMELVTEPVIKSAKEAGDFARELQLLLRYLGVSDANMEKGEMRVEANISISKDAGKLGTKVEVKNINSFRAVERAIAYEVSRHEALLDAGEKVLQETRGWNEDTQKTFAQRRKEESHDYRYFPDPDLPKLAISEISEFRKEVLQKEMPELPEAKRVRYAKEFGIKPEDIELFVNEPLYAGYFERVVQALKNKPSLVKLASNYILSDLVGQSKVGGWKETAVPPLILAELTILLEAGELSSRGAKELIALYYAEGATLAGKSLKEVATEKGLIQKSNNDELTKVAESLIAEHPKAVEEFKAGKVASLQFLVGQGMKATHGSANPGKLRTILEGLLN